MHEGEPSIGGSDLEIEGTDQELFEGSKTYAPKITSKTTVDSLRVRIDELRQCASSSHDEQETLRIVHEIGFLEEELFFRTRGINK